MLRFLFLAALAVWIGGLVVLGGIGAPAVFDVLQSHDPVAGRIVAGVLFGEMLLRFARWSWALGAGMLVILAARAALGPRLGQLASAILVAAMLGLTSYTALNLFPRIDAIRRDVPGTIAALPDTDPRKYEFARLHGLSGVMMGLTLVGGLVVLWTETRRDGK